MKYINLKIIGSGNNNPLVRYGLITSTLLIYFYNKFSFNEAFKLFNIYIGFLKKDNYRIWWISINKYSRLWEYIFHMSIGGGSSWNYYEYYQNGFLEVNLQRRKKCTYMER